MRAASAEVLGDKASGGGLWRHLRQATKKRRKRYRSHDSRGKLPGKRDISECPPEVERRQEQGHWEIDTVKGDSQGAHTVVTMVERSSGYTMIGKLARHTAADATACCIELIARAGAVLTITADNGTEFHSYAQIEAGTGVPWYFATPHHSWERGTNENTNGLVRQYLKQAHVTQTDCDAIAAKLNSRPRKRLGYRTPEECYGKAG
jgi:transposase, IS30 family